MASNLINDNYAIYKYIEDGNSIRDASIKFNKSYTRASEIAHKTRKIIANGFDYEAFDVLGFRIVSALNKTGVKTRNDAITKINNGTLNPLTTGGIGLKGFKVLCDHLGIKA